MNVEVWKSCVMVGAAFLVATITYLLARFGSRFDSKDEKKQRKLDSTIDERDTSLSMPKGNVTLYWKDFMDLWIVDRKNKEGYFYEHRSGVYVIMVFDKPVRRNNFSNYENVYVGQSVWMSNRVHNHFIGKGNGDVYADVKYGKAVYVKLIYCDREKMNDLETKLIDKYHATDSYNGTKGGSTDWNRKGYE